MEGKDEKDTKQEQIDTTAKEETKTEQKEEDKKEEMKKVVMTEDEYLLQKVQKMSMEINQGVDEDEYIEDKLKDIAITDEQKNLIKEAFKDEKQTKAKISELLKTLNTKNVKHQKAKKQIEQLAPLYDTHEFWETQPVPKATEIVNPDKYDKPIDGVKTIADVRENPYPLPKGFVWADIDINNKEQAKEVYDLLYQNYVEDEDAMFRFDYSVEFLQWALAVPDGREGWIFGVRGGAKKKLFGFISGIPVHMSVNKQEITMAEINFLCVHKSLRSKRLAPVLIKEVTRRVNLQNIWQAVYTAGVVIPKPISKTTYFHRSLNPKKLLDVGFSHRPQHTPLARYLKLHKIPTECKINELRPMEEKDVESVHKILNNYLQKFPFHMKFTADEVRHFLLPRKDVIYTYVVEDANKQVTDMISFYYLPSSILKHVEHKTLRVAYSYYNVPGQFDALELMKKAIMLASAEGFDVLNALDIMENAKALGELKFGIGDGNLHYYLYNWRVKDFLAPQIGMVLV